MTDPPLAETGECAQGYVEQAGGVAPTSSGTDAAEIEARFASRYSKYRFLHADLYLACTLLDWMSIAGGDGLPDDPAEIDEWIVAYNVVYCEWALSRRVNRDRLTYPQWRLTSPLARIWTRAFRTEFGEGILTWEDVSQIAKADNDRGRQARRDLHATLGSHFNLLGPGGTASHRSQEDVVKELMESAATTLDERRAQLTNTGVFDLREYAKRRLWKNIGGLRKVDMINKILEKEGFTSGQE